MPRRPSALSEAAMPARGAARRPGRPGGRADRPGAEGGRRAPGKGVAAGSGLRQGPDRDRVGVSTAAPRHGIAAAIAAVLAGSRAAARRLLLNRSSRRRAASACLCCRTSPRDPYYGAPLYPLIHPDSLIPRTIRVIRAKSLPSSTTTRGRPRCRAGCRGCQAGPAVVPLPGLPRRSNRRPGSIQEAPPSGPATAQGRAACRKSW
jgi:hypothetical protein